MTRPSRAAALFSLLVLFLAACAPAAPPPSPAPAPATPAAPAQTPPTTGPATGATAAVFERSASIKIRQLAAESLFKVALPGRARVSRLFGL